MDFETIKESIPEADDWESATPLTRGIGLDKKYLLRHRDGSKLLLRLAPASEYDTKKRVFDLITLAGQQSDVPMPRPVHLGKTRDAQQVYMVLSWLEGQDFDTGIAALTNSQHFAFGVESGQLLRRIHSAVDPGAPPVNWEKSIQERLESYIAWYKESGLQFADDEKILRYLRKNLPLMRGRPQAILHNDFHIGNFILQPDGRLGIIDFDFARIGDPLEDTRWMLFTRGQGHVTMANGQIHGYFDSAKPPPEFFEILAYYAALGLIGSLQFQWRRRASKGQPVDAVGMEPTLKGIEARSDDFDTFQSPVPRWYRYGAP